ncbi:MAG: superoxide dismutase [Hyphomicrobiaceae bacterium]
MLNRRDAVKLATGAAALGLVPSASSPVGLSGTASAQQAVPAAGAFTLPPLGYAFEALEPHIDAETMRVHHGTHHAGYVRNLNALAAEHPALAKAPMERTLGAIDRLPAPIRDGVRNNMGGHWNHSFFWQVMAPGGSKAPTGKLATAIDASFGSMLAMQEAVTKAGLTRFGSGWAWLGVGKDGKLKVFSTPYQDTPHMVPGIKGAVLGIDVWEHAYYLKHKAARGAYLKSWWNVVNWEKAAENFGRVAS